MFDDKVVFEACLHTVIHTPVEFRELRCFTTQVLSPSHSAVKLPVSCKRAKFGVAQ